MHYLKLERFADNHVRAAIAAGGSYQTLTAYNGALSKVLLALHTENATFPPTNEMLIAKVAALPPSRHAQFRSGWKMLMRFIMEQRVAAPTIVPELWEQLKPMPDNRFNLDTPSARNGKSKHPIGVPVAMWLELLRCDPVALCKLTGAEADVMLGYISPSERHNVYVQARNAIRAWCYGETIRMGCNAVEPWDTPEAQRHPFLFDPATKAPMTPDTVLDMLKGEGLTLPALKKGYFYNDVVWYEKDGSKAALGCTFQLEVLQANGIVPSDISTFYPNDSLRNNFTNTVITTSDKFRHGGWSYPDPVTGANEIDTPATDAWWKAYYGFRCPLHGLRDTRTPEQRLFDEYEKKVGKEVAAMKLAELVGRLDENGNSFITQLVGVENKGNGYVPIAPSEPKSPVKLVRTYQPCQVCAACLIGEPCIDPVSG